MAPPGTDPGFLCAPAVRTADKCGMFEFYQCKADEDVFWCLYLWKNKDRKFGFGPVRGEFSTEFMQKRCSHLNFQPLRSFRDLNSLMLFGVCSVIEQLSSLAPSCLISARVRLFSVCFVPCLGGIYAWNSEVDLWVKNKINADADFTQGRMRDQPRPP